jgi:hypothetical protein
MTARRLRRANGLQSLSRTRGIPHRSRVTVATPAPAPVRPGAADGDEDERAGPKSHRAQPGGAKMTIMNGWVGAVLPFVSALVGAAMTYVLNIRGRRRTERDGVSHSAIAAVAAAQASADYVSDAPPYAGASAEEHERFLLEIRREGLAEFCRRHGEARTSVARASAYVPRLASFAALPITEFLRRSDDLMVELRKAISGWVQRGNVSRCPLGHCLHPGRPDASPDGSAPSGPTSRHWPTR